MRFQIAEFVRGSERNKMKVKYKVNGSYMGYSMVVGREQDLPMDIAENMIETGKAKAAKLPKEGFIKLNTESKNAKSKISKEP